MRATLVLVAMVLIGLARPALAECFGKYPNITCISDSGSVWTPQGYYSGYSYKGYKSDGSKIARFPNGTGARSDGAEAAGSGTPGKTEVLQPSAQSGNAWVVTPQSNDGATVCGAGASC